MAKEAMVNAGAIKTHTREDVDGNPVDERYNPLPKSKEVRDAVLVQNETGACKFVPRWLAEELVKAKRVIAITPADGKMYIEATKRALGIFDGFNPGEGIQIGAKVIHQDQIGRFDAKEVLAAAEEAVKTLGPTKAIEVVNGGGKLEDFATRQRDQQRKKLE